MTHCAPVRHGACCCAGLVERRALYAGVCGRGGSGRGSLGGGASAALAPREVLRAQQQARREYTGSARDLLTHSTSGTLLSELVAVAA